MPSGLSLQPNMLMQDYEEALRANPSNLFALMRKGEVLTVLKKSSVCHAYSSNVLAQNGLR